MYAKPLGDVQLSIVVVGYKMPRQLANTLYTLSRAYQQGIDALSYEVIVLENVSEHTLSPSVVDSLPENFRYYLRDEPSVSPAAALNQGLRLAKGSIVGMMVDGAHLLSPGVLRYAQMAFRMASDAFVAVPVYHLGPKEQDESSQEGYDEAAEMQLLSSVDWKADGYKLFDVSALCSANANGIFTPIMESNCYFAKADAFREIGYVDETFQLAGGGSLNLHLTRQLGTRKDSEYFMLGGEGTFHQYHGGVTSSSNRSNVVEAQAVQLHEKWNGNYRFLSRNPTILGKFRTETHRTLKHSIEKMMRRVLICRHNNEKLWGDDQL